MKNILYIDTAEQEVIKVGLEINGKKSEVKKENVKGSQVLLVLIDQVLSKSKIKPAEINEITINSGPGSFTGLRVGFAVANTLGYFLNIPVNGKKVKEVVEPKYK
ncbi:tRNA (adenosine(37)-N6)-threonylcarbamoyltransferase complex dimerization subunit type 1 TsaB [Patescibacteria group bacterium]|nr:tRNA (adenosine(37)-N6)-threonylcarbamoyltransferase complex dimerization subunit type 1 TsaB [Patescibacteria group bacterium]